MDLSAIKPDTLPVEIRHPGTGLRTGLVIECSSLESDAVRRVKRKHMDASLRMRNRKPTASELEDRMLDIYCASVVGWQWNGDAAWTGGKKLDLTPENVRAVVSTPWIRKQIEEAIEDDQAFFSS